MNCEKAIICFEIIISIISNFLPVNIYSIYIEYMNNSEYNIDYDTLHNDLGKTLLTLNDNYILMVGGSNTKIKTNNNNKSNKISQKSTEVNLPRKFANLVKTKKNNLARSNTNKLVIDVPQEDGSTKQYTNEYTNPIINFIQDATIIEIQKWLYVFLRYTHGTACDKYLGYGFIGSVKKNAFGPTYTLHYENDIDVTIPIVIKETNVENELMMTVIENDLYIYNSRGINVEAIIMYFMKPLIQLKLSPHLPLIIEHGKCIFTETQPVDRIVSEMHGLSENIYVDLNGFYESPMWKHNDLFDPKNPAILSNFAVLEDLCLFINIKKNSDDEITLPNGITCNVIELIDYLSISYLVTYDLLKKYNIHLLDMHPQNVFIHWLTENSYMRDQYIGDTEYIFYKVGKTYYKIKTFGLLLKMGDIGASIIHPKKNVFIAGQVYDIESTYPIIKKLVNTTKCHEFFTEFPKMLTTGTYRKTTGYSIINSKPYDELYWTGVTEDQFNQMLNPELMLLKFFSKYSVDKVDEKENYLVF
jgi:hypothetical protein